MFQYKLFKIYYKNKEDTIRSINNTFQSDCIWKINDNVIAISYDNVENYKYILNQVCKLNASQVIVGLSKMVKFLDQIIDDNFIIDEIHFTEIIPLENQKLINNIIKSINSRKDDKEKMNLKNDLFEELKWLTTDGCIDIEHIDIEINQESEYKGAKLYINGTIVFEDEHTKLYINSILSEVFRRI